MYNSFDSPVHQLIQLCQAKSMDVMSLGVLETIVEFDLRTQFHLVLKIRRKMIPITFFDRI